jgi:CDP-diglyceride synthetase
MRLLETVYLILPLLVAGAVHAPVIKKDLMPWLAKPLDFGRSFRGSRIFGQNKTWRGVLLMGVVSVLVVFVQTQAYALEPFHRISIVDYSRTSWFALGLALGLSYSLSELPNSFFKRRLGISPGGISTKRAVVQYGIDQADSAIGGTLALIFFLGLRWDTLALVFALGFLLHVLMDQLFFLFAVKRRSTLPRVPLEGQPTC